MTRGYPLNRDRILGTDAPMCSSGKRGFTTQEEARRGNPRDPNQYRCGVCKHWHTSSFVRTQRRSVLGNIRTGAKLRRH